MKFRLLFLALILSVQGYAQISGAGQLGCPGTAVTGSTWNSGTAGNSVQTLYGPGSASGVTVVLDQTTTITGGAVTFLGDYGDGNFVNVPAFPLGMINPATNGSLANPYTLVASTNQAFFIPMLGMNRLQLKLSTALTGSGTITPFTTLWCGSVALPNASVNETQINGVVPDMNSGNKSAATQRIVWATDTPTNTNNFNVAVNAALPAGSNVIGTVPQVATATTTDSVLGCYLISAASTNSTSCKGSSGNFYGVFMVNTTATVYYLRLYNSSSAPTCSSATGFIETIPIPASATGAGVVIALPVGLGYSTGIGFCFTGGSSSTDNTNAATGVFGAVLYK